MPFFVSVLLAMLHKDLRLADSSYAKMFKQKISLYRGEYLVADLMLLRF